VTQINVQDAKTRLSDLLACAERGEEIVIARAGVPVARLVALKAPPRRAFGGESFVVSDDFDAPLSETEVSAWE
jgi:prevent-host-death family protein